MSVTQSLRAILDAVLSHRKVIQEARRLDVEHKARVEQYEAEWRKENPGLVALGAPAPPTPQSMTRIGVHGFGGFYQP